MLSKGHAGPVAYATFGLMGFYPMAEAYTLNQPHTKFPSHTDRKLTPGVEDVYKRQVIKGGEYVLPEA